MQLEALKKIFSALNEENIRYLIAGGLAVGTSYTLNLETDGTDKYSMSAIITGMDHTVSVTGEAMVTASFISTGNVTKTIS